MVKSFLGAYGQMIAVGATTVFISQGAYALQFMGALAVNAFWIYNVGSIVKADKKQKWTIAIGATLGSVTGSFLARTIL